MHLYSKYWLDLMNQNVFNPNQSQSRWSYLYQTMSLLWSWNTLTTATLPILLPALISNRPKCRGCFCFSLAHLLWALNNTKHLSGTKHCKDEDEVANISSSHKMLVKNKERILQFKQHVVNFSYEELFCAMENKYDGETCLANLAACLFQLLIVNICFNSVSSSITQTVVLLISGASDFHILSRHDRGS